MIKNKLMYQKELLVIFVIQIKTVWFHICTSSLLSLLSSYQSEASLFRAQCILLDILDALATMLWDLSYTVKNVVFEVIFRLLKRSELSDLSLLGISESIKNKVQVLILQVKRNHVKKRLNWLVIYEVSFFIFFVMFYKEQH